MTTWKDSMDRRNEVKAAYLEAYRQAVIDCGRELPEQYGPENAEDAWAESDARKRLEKPLD